MARGVLSGMGDVLKDAVEARVLSDAEPVRKILDGLRRASMEYEEAFLVELRESAISAMLTAVGGSPGPVPDAGPARDALLRAMEEVRGAVGHPRPVPAPEIVHFDTGLPEPELIPSQRAQPRPPVEVRPEVVEEAVKLLMEFDVFMKTFQTEHEIRLGILLRLHVADVRRLLLKVPMSHPVYPGLSEAVRKAGHVKSERPEVGFIRGLAHHHDDDWTTVANSLRQRLHKLDRDAARRTSMIDKSPPSSKRRNGKADRNPMFSWPEVPNLRSAMSSGPVIVVGGSFVDDKKHVTVYARLGLAFEWLPLMSDEIRATQSIADRIRSKSIVAVVVMNGYMSHKIWTHLQDACDAGGVPYALAGKGGIGGIEAAVQELEQKLSKTQVA